MQFISEKFTKHPNSVGESYFKHLTAAFSFGLNMILAGLACILHGIFPFLYIKTGSNTITQLHNNMVINREKRTNPL